jgi:predicted nucleotidyltransferase component of viral defense system
MAFREGYQKQAALLVRALPHVAEEKDFALKGGTAINLFVRDFPRLSVDIDLTFLPVLPRPDSIAAVNAGMARVADRIRKSLAGAHVHEHKTSDGILIRLIVRLDGVQIKIEINPVMRGSVYEPIVMSVSEKVEAAFGYAEIKVVSKADLYAGKLMAALDRQHPRDLFDVRDLLANEGITDDLRRAFIVYLISHDRPMAEVLHANLKDIAEEYERGFAGMTQQDVPLDTLLAARQQMIDIVIGKMPADHRAFLISFERGTPDWSLLGLPAAMDLPAVKWRQLNLDKLSKDRRDALVAQLEEVLGR